MSDQWDVVADVRCFMWLTLFPKFLAKDIFRTMDKKEGPALTDTAKMVFDTFAWGRCRVCPIPWLDFLTHCQHEAIYIIEWYDQYDEALWTKVDTWMEEMPLVSMDMESQIGEEHPFTAQVAFMHSFCVVIFHLDKLWHQGTKTSR